MLDTKLIQTLKSFTKDDMKNFEKLVCSPFFNKGRNYLPFLNALKHYHPEFNDATMTYENIYLKIYPDRKFNKQVMWNLVSDLEKLAIEYLLQTSLKGNKMERFVLIYDELSKRNLDRQTLKEIESADKRIGSAKVGKEYFYDKWIIENNKADYWSSNMGKLVKGFQPTIESTEYLLLCLIAELSISVSDILIIKLMYNASEEINGALDLVKSLDLRKLVDAAVKNKNRHAQVMMFYYNKIMSALDETDERYFFEMKKFFDDNYSRFDSMEQKNTIISLANYCAHKMRLGNDKFQKILFEITKFRLEKKIDSYRNEKMAKSLYHQILRNALSLGEVKWSEGFVKEYTSKLRREHQKTMSTLAWGYIFYAKNDFTKSLEHLNKVEFIDLRDKLHVRTLSAKAYYELSEYEPLFYYIDASKHFIGNNPLIENKTKQAYLKFFHFLGKLLACKENPDKKKLKVLREDIQKEKSLRPRHSDWLLEKIDLLLNSEMIEK